MNQDKQLYSIIRETTSELKIRDLIDHVICQCRKHRKTFEWYFLKNVGCL
jgi:hypothetical protein